MKLKTLKDFKKYGIWKANNNPKGNAVLIDDLKQEAIKWVKEDIKDIKITLTEERAECTLIELKRWMKRLDITEGDLK